MSGKLTDIATARLLENFGAGTHKPGSGSAAALQAMLSAQLLRTVIDLTVDPKRSKNYLKYINQLQNIKLEIESRIYPTLETLFQEDYEQFDKVIQLREQRDNAKDFIQKHQLETQHLKALRLATEIPLRIADLSLELGNFSAFVFDNAFKSARGDSGVALSNAIAAIAGCLYIVELNLSSFITDDWTEEIRQHKRYLKSHYNQLHKIGDEKLAFLERESEENMLFHDNMQYFLKGNLAEKIKSDSEIEEIVKRLQNTLWTYRKKIWRHEIPEYYIQVLKPDVVLKKVMKYNYEERDNLGIHGADRDLFQIAGLIDKTKKLVQVSKKFPKESQLFTVAHELGHLVLHDQPVLHRDRPIDGSMVPLSLEEKQANKFAAYFLMPSKLVKELFLEIFEMSKFFINENTTLGFSFRDINEFRRRCPNTRDLSRLLASAEHFNGKTFISIAKIFSVSDETMAIRLEELNLLEL